MHLLAGHAVFAGAVFDLLIWDSALSKLPNRMKATPFDVARVMCRECTESMKRALCFDDRYELEVGKPAYASATCVVVFAVDHDDIDEATCKGRRGPGDPTRSAATALLLPCLDWRAHQHLC